jgi:uncharacterized protein DUF4240
MLRAMDDTEFWLLLDRSREAREAQEVALERLLAGRSREELIAFDRIYQEHLARVTGGTSGVPDTSSAAA